MFNRTASRILSRKGAKKNIFLFLRTWRALPIDLAQGGELIEPRLCASHLFLDSVVQTQPKFHICFDSFSSGYHLFQPEAESGLLSPLQSPMDSAPRFG
jgi:hypothetical protein